MIKTMWTLFVSTVVVFVFAGTLFFTLTPQSAPAASLTFGTSCVPGREAPGTHICVCPTELGNCICMFPDDPAPVLDAQ